MPRSITGTAGAVDGAGPAAGRRCGGRRRCWPGRMQRRPGHRRPTPGRRRCPAPTSIDLGTASTKLTAEHDARVPGRRGVSRTAPPPRWSCGSSTTAPSPVTGDASAREGRPARSLLAGATGLPRPARTVGGREHLADAARRRRAVRGAVAVRNGQRLARRPGRPRRARGSASRAPRPASAAAPPARRPGSIEIPAQSATSS